MAPWIVLSVLLTLCACTAAHKTPTDVHDMSGDELAREYIGRIDVQGLVMAELAAEAVRRGVPAGCIPGLVRDISLAMDFPAINAELARMAASRFTRRDLLDLLNRTGRVDLPPLSDKIARFADDMGRLLRNTVDHAVLNSFGMTI